MHNMYMYNNIHVPVFLAQILLSVVHLVFFISSVKKTYYNYYADPFLLINIQMEIILMITRGWYTYASIMDS